MEYFQNYIVASWLLRFAFLVAWHLEAESNLGSNLRSAQCNLGKILYVPSLSKL